MNKKYKLVYIKWCDACTRQGWHTEEEAFDWAESFDWHVESVGWVLRETKTFILIASQITENEDLSVTSNKLLKIPKTWVIKKVDIKIK